MERTRGIFRRPFVWIILVIVGAIALSSFFTGGQEYTKVDTSVALAELLGPRIALGELVGVPLRADEEDGAQHGLLGTALNGVR